MSHAQTLKIQFFLSFLSGHTFCEFLSVCLFVCLLYPFQIFNSQCSFIFSLSISLSLSHSLSGFPLSLSIVSSLCVVPTVTTNPYTHLLNHKYLCFEYWWRHSQLALTLTLTLFENLVLKEKNVFSFKLVKKEIYCYFAWRLTLLQKEITFTTK